LPFSGHEALDLSLTFNTVEEARGDDRDQQRGRVHGLFDACLPILSPGDVVTVLKDYELFAGLYPDFCAEAFSERSKLTILMHIIEGDIAEECCPLPRPPGSWRHSERADRGLDPASLRGGSGARTNR
jgi:hypothetical protein